MTTNIVQKSQLIRKLRPSLYQMPAGELVGFGPLEAKGNGHSFCYNCNERDCRHVKAVSEAWFGGQSIEQEFITYTTGTVGQVLDYNLAAGQLKVVW